MALFGSKEKTSLAKKTVRPTVVRTQNVAKELQSIAKSYQSKLDFLDFNILEVNTYSRMGDAAKETEWEEVEQENLYELDDKTALLNPLFQIKQTYEIEIFSPSKDMRTPCKDLKTAVGANASKCKVYLSIAAGSKLEYVKTLEDDLKTLIKKKKVRAGILIGIFDEMINDAVSKISAQARVEDGIEYEKAKTILIAEGIEPTATTNDEIILHYENSTDVDENAKVDYSSRGFIQSVKEGELLIEYVKAKQGLPGRNCRGEFMQPKEPVVTNEITFEVDSNIRVSEDEDSIKYYAKENGYIVFEDNLYTIKTDIDVGEISFKTTGSINSGVDSDVNISVKETDAVKDAIGTGMSVEVSEIDIDGNVGSNAKVTALKATIGGQTHGSAIIKADDLDINVHKGKAYGKSIKITRLEHGEVEGDSINISQALGGTIKGKDVTIGICSSHVKVTASMKIEIGKLQGSENIFIIDPLVQKSEQEKLNENTGDIKELTESVDDLFREVSKYTQMIKEGTSAFQEIKKRLMHYKKNGVKMPASFVKKYKQFTGMQDKLKELQESYRIKKDQLDLHLNKTSSFQDNILEARVINRDRWKGYNEIKFKLVDPPIELVYKPEEGSKDMIFGLVEVEEGEFMIKAMSE